MIETSSLRRKLLDLAITGKLVPRTGEWKRVRFADVCSEFNVGIVIKPTRYYVKDGGLRAFRNANVKPDRIDDSDWALVSKDAVKENPRCVVHTGDILIARSGAPGIAAPVSKEYDGYAAIDVLIATPQSNVADARYLSYFINSHEQQRKISGMNRGVALSHIGVRTISELSVDFPPLAEQKAIVKRLDELLALEREIADDSTAVDKLIVVAKRKILDLAISGKLVAKRGAWKVEKLDALCDSINGLWKGSTPPFAKVGVIRAANFTKDCELNLDKTVYIDVEVKKYQQRKLIANDLIVERSGGGPGQPVGRVVLFPDIAGEYSVSNFTSILRVRDCACVDPRYLQRALVAIYNTGYTGKIQTQTTNLHNLNFKEYLKIDIPLPPLAEQKAIVAKVDELFSVLDAMKGSQK